MRKADCEICRGARIVRLPIYRAVSVQTFNASAAVALEPSSRDYPCPECGDSVPQDSVAVLDAHAMVGDRITGPAFQEHAKRTAARMLVDHLLRGGFITFERGPANPRLETYPMVATLGVVAPGQIATLELRVAERQDLLARAVADEAIKQIDNWGSYYSHSRIDKGTAADFIREAVKRVSATWSKARAIAEESQS